MRIGPFYIYKLQAHTMLRRKNNGYDMTCRQCGSDLKAGQHVCSKATTRRQRYVYHLECATQVNIVDPKTLKKVVLA